MLMPERGENVTPVIDLIAAAILLAITPPPEPPPYKPPPSYFEGSLSRYDPGVMERVIDWRHTHGIPAGFDPYREDYAYIAVIDCRNVGRSGWLTPTIDGVTYEPRRVYVADCTSPGRPAAKWMYDEVIAAEVDFAAWIDWGIVDGEGAWVVVVLDE